MCGAHATVRGFLGELVENTRIERDVVVDMEAGLEHMSRGTGRHVSHILAVVEPYYRSMETARRIVELSAEMGIERVQAVANKVRDAEDRAAIQEFCARHDIDILGEVPYDPTLVVAERLARSPLDYDAGSPSMSAIAGLARALTA